MNQRSDPKNTLSVGLQEYRWDDKVQIMWEPGFERFIHFGPRTAELSRLNHPLRSKC